MSGETFFTLGYGDLTPATWAGRLLSVVEAGTGFGFMAIVIGYLPVLYQAFSRREMVIGLFDARAGSPPTAERFLERLAAGGGLSQLESLLGEWERWCAELLEGQLSFPVLAFYRSQHDNQSWLAGLSTILDTCAVLLAHAPAINRYQVQVTFAMARHAAVDLAMIFGTPPSDQPRDRLPIEPYREFFESAELCGLESRPGGNSKSAAE